MKTTIRITKVLLVVVFILLAPHLAGASVRLYLSGSVLLDSYVPNPDFSEADATLAEDGGTNLASLHIYSDSYYDPSDPYSDTCDVAYLGTSTAYVNMECGKKYILTLSGQACSASRYVSLGFSYLPAGHMLEFQDSNNSVFDGVTSVRITGIQSKTWKVSVKPKRIHFSSDTVSADGRSQVRANVSFLYGTSSNYFRGNPIWSIVGDTLGCTIDTNTGWICVGTEPGEITVRAADSNTITKVVSGSLRVGCQTCTAGPCGLGQGIVGNLRNALAVDMGVLPCDRSFMESIRLKLTSPAAALTTPAGLIYDQTNYDNAVPEIIYNTAGLRQVLAPQCLADVVTNSDSCEIRLYWAEFAGTKSNGLYYPTGSPFKVWKMTSLASGNTQFSITEDPTGANSVSTFTWSASDNGWTLNRNSTVQERKITQSGLPAVAPREVSRRTETVETSIVNDSAIASRATKTYATLDLGGIQRPDVLVEERVDGCLADGSPANLDQVTSYYYAASAMTNGHEKMQRMARSDGYWEHYDYSGDRISKVYSPWQNSAAPSDIDTVPTSVAHKEVAYDYTLLDSDPGTDLVTPRRTEVYVKDSGGASLQLVSRSYVLFTNDNQSYPRVKVRRDIACRDSSAAWNDTNNAVTVTRTYLDGTFKEAVRSIDRTDGTRSLYSYTETTTEVREGAAGAGVTVTNGILTRVTKTARGYVQLTEVFDIATNKKMVSDAWSAPGTNDPQGRFTLLTHLDNTTESYSYDCCTLTQVTDREGVTTVYTPDALKRSWKTTVNGVETKNTFDGAGRVVKVTRTGSTVTDVVPLRAYDRGGRVVLEQNALLGGTTLIESTNASGGRMVTITYPDNGTRIEEYYSDGRLAKITGTAVKPVQFEYGFDATAGQLYIKETKLDGNGAVTSEWTKTYVDFLGRSYKIVFADATGAPYSQRFYKDNGQLWKERDPDGVLTVYIYNTRGQVEYTMKGLANEPSTPPTSPDTSGNHQITQVQTFVWTYVDGGVTNDTAVTRLTEWTTPDSSANVVTLERYVSLNGLRQWDIAYPNDSAKQVLKGVTQYATGVRTITNTYPDNSTKVNTYTNGRLASITCYSSSGNQLSQVSYGYDGDGNVHTMNDARNGTTTYTHNAADQVETVTTPIPATGLAAQVTTIRYNKMMQATNVVQPDLTSLFGEYYPNGLLKKVYGSRTYPAQYGYDAQGRMTNMVTWTNYIMSAGAATTTWKYDSYRGFLTNKLYADNHGIGFSFTPAGRLRTRVWSRGVSATYSNDAAGLLTSITYSDGTQGITNTYNRRGRLTTILHGTNVTSFSYSDSGQVLSESINGLAVTNGYDSLSRRVTLALSTDASTLVSYGFDSASRLYSVTNGVYTVTYDYVTNSPWISTMTYKHGGNTRLTANKDYDYLNRLTKITGISGASTIGSYAYGYNAANQRSSMTNVDQSLWIYQYDALGQLTNASRYWNDGAFVGGQQFKYQFNDIGNRLYAAVGGDQAGANLRYESYTANNLNQYTQRTVPGALDIIGSAHSNSTVTVNNLRGSRKGEYFRVEYTLNNTNAFAYQSVTNIAVLQNGTNADVVATNIGSVFLQRNPENFSYDLDGNLTTNGIWTLTWDAENRLIVAESKTNLPQALRLKLAFGYDYRSRRNSKTVYNWNGTNWTLVTSVKYIYDGYNLFAELNATNASVIRSYVWGQDFGNLDQGAGGVGGLLAINGGANGTHFVVYDGIGNVRLLVNATNGITSASYEYGPFGEVIRKSGVMAKLNPFRFSTKPQDDETDFTYYGFGRYYDARLGIWLSRDPIGEDGGINVYGFVGNNPVDRVDYLGLALYAFDGTNNDGDRDRMDDPNAPNGPTNVKILADVYRQRKVYMHGVGTRESKEWINTLGMATGYGGATRIEDMLGFLRQQVVNGDTSIDIIGFSRGAAMAREFANQVKDQYRCLKIRFLGLFDTVASFGLGGNDVNIGYRLGVPDIVETVMHLTAQDERRYFFPLSSIKSGQHARIRQPDWWEFSLPGVHSDVGGGYRDNRQFANKSLQIMHQQAVPRGVPFGPIPPEYRDTDTTGLKPHDSRWANDKIVDAWKWIYREPRRPREIYYHPLTISQ